VALCSIANTEVNHETLTSRLLVLGAEQLKTFRSYRNCFTDSGTADGAVQSAEFRPRMWRCESFQYCGRSVHVAGSDLYGRAA